MAEFMFHYIKNLQGTKTDCVMPCEFLSFITSKTYKVLKLAVFALPERPRFITSKTYKVLKRWCAAILGVFVSLHQKLTRY